MRFLSAAHTDVGLTKKINQDAFCLKIARAGNTPIAFAVLCDGMGGLNNGEYASAVVVNAFAAWFEAEFPLMMASRFDQEAVVTRWKEIVNYQGAQLLDYGYSRGISLGTTLTALLIVDHDLTCIHVGDSRLYRISDYLMQMSKDQTVAEYEIDNNRLTVEEARYDPRSSILLQCVGASKVINPEVIRDTVRENEAYLLCSDGFRHQITPEEIFGVTAPSVLTSEKVMKKSLVDLIELDKARKERDNITAVLIKTII